MFERLSGRKNDKSISFIHKSVFLLIVYMNHMNMN